MSIQSTPSVHIDADLPGCTLTELAHEDNQEAHIPLPKWLQDNLAHLGIETWFPVQQMIIPKLLARDKILSSETRKAAFHDLIVNAPTGSGKTLAYAVPIVMVRMSVLCAACSRTIW